MLEEAVQYVKFLQLQIKVRTFAVQFSSILKAPCLCVTESLLVFMNYSLQLLSSDEMWMYAPIAYNGMNIGIDLNLSQH